MGSLVAEVGEERRVALVHTLAALPHAQHRRAKARRPYPVRIVRLARRVGESVARLTELAADAPHQPGTVVHAGAVGVGAPQVGGAAIHAVRGVLDVRRLALSASPAAADATVTAAATIVGKWMLAAAVAVAAMLIMVRTAAANAAGGSATARGLGERRGATGAIHRHHRRTRR